MFEATQVASQQITDTFNMVWPIEAGLWNLRQSAEKFFEQNPNASAVDAKNELIKGLSIHGLNLKHIATELSWEYEEQYIAKLLLINATAIFDSWVDSFVDSVLCSESKNRRKTIKEELERGDSATFETALANEATSLLANCFRPGAARQDCYMQNLWLVYKYFKRCRNCCVHGNQVFSKQTEESYNSIKGLTKEDCGLKEFPQINKTEKDKPLVISLRGVFGFYDIILRIIKHYDILASEKVAVEKELLKRWKSKSLPSFFAVQHKSSNTKDYRRKRDSAIRSHLEAINMCLPYANRMDSIFCFLNTHN